MKHYHKNPRQITKRQMSDLQKWLVEFGDLSGIVHNIPTDEIIGGNQRSEALPGVISGLIQPVIKERYDPPLEDGTVCNGYYEIDGRKYAYRGVNWDDKKAERANLIANKAGGTFNMDILANQFDLPVLLDSGFEERELIGFDFGEPKDAEPQTDRAAELLEKWQVTPGSLWQIGEHRLICGDCTDAAVVARVMGENKIDLLFTSPPYNQGGESRNGDLATNGNGKVALYDEYKDDLSDEDYKELLFKFIEVAAPFVSDVHSVVVNISYNSNARDLYGKVLFSDRNPFTVRETIVWDKKSALNFPNSGIYSRRCEFIFVMSKSAKYLFSEWNGTRWNYYEVSKENQMKEHRAAFPLPLSERVLSEFSNSGSIVYEPFAGTGTTLVACQNLSRRGRAIEISPAYCAVTLERMAQAFPGIEIQRIPNDAQD